MDGVTPLTDTALALATPEQLIAMLEQKCSPSQGHERRAQVVEESQPPNP